MRVRTEEKRQSIVDVAAEVFGELGFERSSMDEIAARVGGSKATLYGYFASKEALFIEVTRAAAAAQMAPAFSELEGDVEDLGATLRRFGEKLMAFICSAAASQVVRMVVSQSAASAIGREFYEDGPRKGNETIAVFLEKAMAAGQLRKADAAVAAEHLVALLQSEVIWRLLYGVQIAPSRQHIKQVVDRAVTVFMAAYAP